MFSVTDVRKRLKLGEIVCDSLQLVEEINKIRNQEKEKFNKKYKALRHDNILVKIREYNSMAKELGVLEIKESSYKNSQNKKQPKFLFTESQARVFIADESMFGKVLLTTFIDNLFVENEFLKFSIENTKATHENLYDLIKEHKLEKVNSEYAKINSFINMTVAKKFNIKQGELKKESMTTEQLEFRAIVENKWSEYYNGKKSGIKAKIESEVL